MGLGSQLESASSIVTERHKVNIQILTIVASAISIVTCLATLYWFVMMKRNFRRRYVSQRHCQIPDFCSPYKVSSCY